MSMKSLTPLVLIGAITLLGCAGDDAKTEKTDTGKTTASDSSDKASGPGTALTPENTKIEFIGIHTGDKPDPRQGSFQELKGEAVVEEGSLKSVSVEIETASITSEADKLTAHLKSADFFDVNEHPTAMFKSTKIEPGDDGMVAITGEFTLLGVTKPVSFPATVSTADGLTLSAEFTLDRSEFGMEYSLDKIDKDVAMTITIGK